MLKIFSDANYIGHKVFVKKIFTAGKYTTRNLFVKEMRLFCPTPQTFDECSEGNTCAAFGQVTARSLVWSAFIEATAGDIEVSPGPIAAKMG